MADKKEMKIFTLSEYEEEEQYLNQMARSGYLFEKVTLPLSESFIFKAVPRAVAVVFRCHPAPGGSLYMGLA